VQPDLSSDYVNNFDSNIFIDLECVKVCYPINSQRKANFGKEKDLEIRAVAMAILQFGGFAFVPSRYAAVITGDPRHTFDGLSFAAGAGLMQSSICFPAIRTGCEIRGKNDACAFRFKKNLPNKGGQNFF
jgi:hypothetical protein